MPARWPLEQGYRQLRQLDALWPDNPQVRALNAQWRKQRELSALSAEALNGYAQAQSQLQRLSAQLDALDERKGRYLTGSELKTAVYGIRQSLKEPPLEELLRQLEEQKQTGEVSLLDREGIPYVTVKFDTPLFAVWSPEGKNAPFVCIEPWYGRCDATDFTGTLQQRDYENMLPQAGTFKAAYSIAYL